MIRYAKPSDITNITKFGIELAKGYNSLRVDPNKIKTLCTQAVNKPNVCIVSEEDGEIKGVLSAFTVDNIAHEKKQAQVVAFHTTVKGDGAKMLRELREWYIKKPVLRRIIMAFDCDYDKRLPLLLNKIGYKQQGSMFIYGG